MKRTYVYDFKDTRQTVAHFVAENANIVNVFAIAERSDRVFSLETQLQGITTERHRLRAADTIGIITDQLCRHIVSAAMVQHFNSIPPDFDNGLYKFGADLLIRPEMQWRTEEELAVAMIKHVPLNESLTGWFGPLISHFKREFFSQIDPWLLVNADIRLNKLVVTVGEDLRHVVYRQMYGGDKWQGDYIFPE